ncbi:hypothetical protein [Sphingomonas beigongshangi]|uniref:hypothetical protein n=1 Tax=Sphingomonas beigongshangi TaxID=2782540 RepID=UPI00193BCBEC|nr:hypothetical protein [Sphingomonas beigongshangi]
MVEEAGARRWCMLRMSGQRTLAVCRALTTLGYDAWTPQIIVRRRRPRSKKTIEIDAAILPTFVFLRADLLHDLYRLMAQPGPGLPAFSIFTYAGRVPLVGDAAMRALRDEEARAAAAHEAVRQREKLLADRTAEQRQRAALRAGARTYQTGERVTIAQPAFAGMTGIVERGMGKAAIVNLGGSISVTIEAWLLEPAGVNREHALVGAAA